MSENTVRELFQNLERAIHERLKVIEDVIISHAKPPVVEPSIKALADRISCLEAELKALRAEKAAPLIPPNPLEGLEVIPKKEVILTETSPEPLSVADRLLLNSSALKALEKDEREEEVEAEAEAEAEPYEEVEAEAEAEAEAEEDAEELEEFEYKGSTYYRDGESNVFMADEDGELIPTPIGVWSEVKKRIIIKKDN